MISITKLCIFTFFIRMRKGYPKERYPYTLAYSVSFIYRVMDQDLLHRKAEN